MDKPASVGIHALEVYFPQSYILLDDLEERDIQLQGEDQRAKIKGKYTKGLGQHALAFCSDHEDIVSIMMNAVSNLMKHYGYKQSDFGRLEIGTESSFDRSKSLKSYIMQLFPENRTLIGVDNVNACYGGTAALLNSLAWVESSQWDGRLALVVAADIAVYEDVNARPTGGCGAVAMVIGPNAPIVIQPGLVASYFSHSYDFYKPNPENPHPIVDGPLSLMIYYESLEQCYMEYRKRQPGLKIEDFDYICLHTPFINHIKKCAGRLLFINDKDPADPIIESTRKDAKIVSEWSQIAKPMFDAKVEPSCLLSRNCGNGYTSSLYLAIASLIDSSDMQNKRVMCFSYGSGSASSMYSFKVEGDISKIKMHLDLKSRLDKRIKRTVLEYEASVKKAHDLYLNAPYQPSDSLEYVSEGCWYLDSVDSKWRRSYKMK